MTKKLLESGIVKSILDRLGVELVVTHQAPWLEGRGERGALQKPRQREFAP